ncbi:unnamed protein product [Arctogadus glacialis]
MAAEEEEEEEAWFANPVSGRFAFPCPDGWRSKPLSGLAQCCLTGRDIGPNLATLDSTRPIVLGLVLRPRPSGPSGAVVAAGGAGLARGLGSRRCVNEGNSEEKEREAGPGALRRNNSPPQCWNTTIWIISAPPDVSLMLTSELSASPGVGA